MVLKTRIFVSAVDENVFQGCFLSMMPIFSIGFFLFLRGFTISSLGSSFPAIPTLQDLALVSSDFLLYPKLISCGIGLSHHLCALSPSWASNPDLFVFPAAVFPMVYLEFPLCYLRAASDSTFSKLESLSSVLASPTVLFLHVQKGWDSVHRLENWDPPPPLKPSSS